MHTCTRIHTLAPCGGTQATRGVEVADKLFADIEGVVVKSLKAVQVLRCAGARACV